MKEIQLTTLVKQFAEAELPPPYQALMQAARRAAEKGYAPYSRFRVGAAVLLANGQVVCGSNQENAAYPSGLCAERVALFYAGANHPDVPVIALAVAALANGKPVKGISPCGSCRQVMLETELRADSPLTLLMDGRNGIELVEGARSLLPLCFDGEELP